MAVAKKAAGTRKAAPRSKAQIHQQRVTAKKVERSNATPASPDDVTDVSEWKAKTQGRALKLPSGFTALVRNPGMQVFIEQGLIPNPLLKIVLSAVDENKPPSQRKLKEMAQDPEQYGLVIELADAVAKFCVLKPSIHDKPLWTEAHHTAGKCLKTEVGQVIPVGSPSRNTDMLYVDEVDLNDKMFIFNWAVGGTANLEQFREEQAAAVADVSSGQVVEQATKRTARTR